VKKQNYNKKQWKWLCASKDANVRFKIKLNIVLVIVLHYASVNSSSAHLPRGWDIRNFIAAQGLGICVPRGDPRAFDTRVFESAMNEFSGKDEAFVEQWLVRQGLEKLVDVFKGVFSIWDITFKIYLKYLMLKTKYKYNQKQLTRTVVLGVLPLHTEQLNILFTD